MNAIDFLSNDFLLSTLSKVNLTKSKGLYTSSEALSSVVLYLKNKNKINFSELIKILDFYKYKNWEFYHLSSNPNIDLDYIKNNLDLPWRDSLRYNPNFKPNDLLNIFDLEFVKSMIDSHDYKTIYQLTENDINIDAVVFEKIINEIKPLNIFRLNKYSISKYSSKALISSIFPDDFYYKNKKLLIIEGIINKGKITKNILKNIIKNIYLGYGELVASKFILNLLTLVNILGDEIKEFTSETKTYIKSDGEYIFKDNKYYYHNKYDQYLESPGLNPNLTLDKIKEYYNTPHEENLLNFRDISKNKFDYYDRTYNDYRKLYKLDNL